MWTAYPWTSYWRGLHEPDIQRVIASIGNGDISGWSCWDLGAHYGYYSVGLAMRVGPSGEVAAFEPNPESFLRLERHKRMNRLNWLKVFESAVSNDSGSALLLPGAVHDSTESHLRYEDEGPNNHGAEIPVRTVRLDELVKAGQLRPPNFVKIDVEGHGHKALDGMREMLARCKPIVLIALHSSFEVEGVLGILKPLGYTWEAVTTPSIHPESMSGGDYLFSAKP
jgi:FkbM family methyltransferase